MSGHFAPLAQGGGGGNSHGKGSNGRGAGRGGGRGVAGAALKRAGLVDEDSGMRDISAAGPSRGTRGAARGRTSATGTDTTQQGASFGGRGAGGRARDRANPLAGRIQRSNVSSKKDILATGTAFGIRGAAVRRGPNDPTPVADLLRNGTGNGKGKGRVPGGGNETLRDRLLNDSTTSHAPNKGYVALLRQFLQSRYNTEAKFLNLESMASDEFLRKENIGVPGSPGAHKDLGSVIWKLSKELFPDVTTVSLANNDFKTLVPIATLPAFLPDIKNLSLQGNDIKWIRDLAFFTPKGRSNTAKFNALQELILQNNPVHDTAVQAGNEQGYRSEVLARFPDLRMLDMQPVSQAEHDSAQLPGSKKSKEQTGIAQGASGAGVEIKDFPLQTPYGNFVDKAVEGVVSPFLAKFFENFDNDRDALRPAYAQDSTFSIVTALPVPPRARSAGFIHSLPRQKDLHWKAYGNVSNHNVMHLGTRPASKGVPRGPGAILGTLNKLPKTTHPLTDASKFAFDAWMLSNQHIGARIDRTDSSMPAPEQLLFCTVHGEFAEAPSQGVRSFTRTFMLAPAPPNSTAANVGWPCVILSDELTVRHYSGTAAWTPGSSPAAAGSNAPGAPQQTRPGSAPNASTQAAPSDLPPHLKDVTASPGMTPEQHNLSLQLAKQTGLTYPFAVQCLVDNAWNASVAMERFQALKATGTIPAEAFAAAL